LRDVPHDADNTAIVAAIVSMGHSLGLRVVAEGVETADQLEFLKQHGCDEVQGFLISEAVAPEHIGAFLAHGWQALPGFRQTADSVRTNRT
jgi:EAL domain-containing protein (putative c-di-GMP-specific phosphodiesterase class I)